MPYTRWRLLTTVFLSWWFLIATAFAAPTITSLTPNSGAIGSSITIAGSGFGATKGTSTVKFNGTSATTSSSSWSDTGITATVPTGATTGSVVVTVSGHASNGVTFTVTPPPNISVLNPSSGIAGSSVNITGSNFGSSQGTGSVSFNGVPANVTTWAAGLIAATVPSAATTGSVQVTAAGGVGSNGVSFTVIPPPGVSDLQPSFAAPGAAVTINGTGFGSSQGSGAVTFNGAPAAITSWSNTSITASVPAGATTGNLVVTASTGASSSGAHFVVVNPGGVSVDQIVTGGLFTPVFSTNAGNELLLAFIATGPGAFGSNSSVTSVSGGNLTWVLVERTNVQSGTAEIWRAFSSAPLARLSVSAQLSASSDASMTVVSFMGVDTSGSNGSGAIGATGTGNGASGTPSATLTTTRNNSAVFGVGEDPVAAKARTPSSNQVLVSQLVNPCVATPPFVCPQPGDTFWVQQAATVVASSGTSVTLKDTAPSNDPYNFSTVEILPATAPSPGPVLTSLSAIAGAPGTSITISGVNFGAAQGSSTITFNGTSAAPSNWGATSIVVPVPNGASTGNVVVTVGGQASNGLKFIVANAAGMAVDQMFVSFPQSFTGAVLGSTFSTSSGNEVLLALVGTAPNGTTGGNIITPLQGGGLTWVRVEQANTQTGTAEVWRAFSPFILNNASVSYSPASGTDVLIIVIALLGADTTGTSGSGAIGATATANAASGAPSATLTSTRANSVVFGAGDDPNAGVARTAGANQTILVQSVNNKCSGSICQPGSNTVWAQQVLGSVAAGTNITVNDIAPTADAYNLSIVELLPSATPLVVAASASPAANAAGWNNSNVTISFTCTGGVAPVSCPQSQTVSTEGANQVVTGIATDGSGVGASTSITLNIDKTPPIVAVSVTPGPNTKGVVTVPATVSFTCNDALSGVASCPPPVQVTTAGLNETFTGTATDNAGNASLPVSLTFSVQTAPLAIVATATPAPNSNNWNNTNVSISYTCSGGVPQVTCPGTQNITTEGAGQNISATATDAAGQSAPISTPVSIDKTLPLITATVTPPPDANGIVIAASAVVGFTCSDALSGIFTCPPSVPVTTAGPQTITGTTVDLAGNTAPATAKFTLQNFPPLSIVASVSTTPNPAGWYKSPVTVTFTCSGGAPPILCAAPQAVSSDGANQVITGTATDANGTTTTVNSPPISLDQTPPLVSITSPADGSVGPSTNVVVSGLASDGLSGLASVSCNTVAATISGANFTCSLQITQGSLGISVIARDLAGNTASTGITTNLQGPKLTINSPSALAFFNNKSITVTGTVDDTSAILAVNGVLAVNSAGSFTAEGVILREGSNVVTATGTNAGGAVGSASVNVVLDTTPPIVVIDSPSDGAAVTSPLVAVTGMVNDVVPGTVNSAQVSVTVNGVKASVANRSFMANDILLVPGKNVVTAVATDRAGNTNQSQITVTLLNAEAQQRIIMVSGNSQSAVVGTVLPQPLVVQVVNAVGQPLPNVPVSFAVVKSDGLVAAFPQQGRQITVQTDASGQARANLQLGTRVGTGNNQVLVTSAGFVGQVMFSETSTVGAAAQVHDIAGQGQKGIVGQLLPEPLVAVVFDANGNSVAGVPVVFKVEQGGGTLEGNTTVTRTTDSDGRVSAVLVLAQQEGINNNVVSASFTGLTGSAASFVASGVTPQNPANTTVSGIVLDNANQPLPNVTASIRGTNLIALTDQNGRFTIAKAPVGSIDLFVDGRTTTDPEPYPFLEFPMVTVAGQDNHFSTPIFLPEIDAANSALVGGDHDVTLTMTGVPGLSFTVFAHSATFPDGSKVGNLSVSQVHADKVPMAPPNATAPRLFWTIQPPRVKFNPPMRITIPNTDGLAPGTVVEIFSYNHDLEEFASGGTARVSEDGSVIVSDPGSGVIVSGWGDAPSPPPPPSCANGCGPCKFCLIAICVKNPFKCNCNSSSTVQVTGPPDNPNPTNDSWQTNFSFLSDSTISAQASANGEPSLIQWTITPASGGKVVTEDPSDLKGPSVSATIALDPPHPPYGQGGRTSASQPLAFTFSAAFCSKTDQHTIKQDERDIIRQEYLNHGLAIPDRSDFASWDSAATSHFTATELKGDPGDSFPYTLLLGNPGQIAENVRAVYNNLLNSDIQVVAPGTTNLAPNTPIIQAGGTFITGHTGPTKGFPKNPLDLGQVLITPKCYPNPPDSCDDQYSADGLSILVGPDGIAHTQALRGDFGIKITSTWRNPERQEFLRSIINGRHQFGNAVDMKPTDADVRNGIGLLQKPQLYCALLTAARNTGVAGQTSIVEQQTTKLLDCTDPRENHVHTEVN